MANKDIILGSEGDLEIQGGDILVDDSLWQEVELIVGLIPGELKYEPKLGPNLIRMIKSRVTDEKIRDAVKRNLEADKKDYEELKSNIRLRVI